MCMSVFLHSLCPESEGYRGSLKNALCVACYGEPRWDCADYSSTELRVEQKTKEKKNNKYYTTSISAGLKNGTTPTADGSRTMGCPQPGTIPLQIKREGKTEGKPKQIQQKPTTNKSTPILTSLPQSCPNDLNPSRTLS